MSSAHTAAYRAVALPPTPTPPPSRLPLGLRLRLRQRLAANVFLADDVAAASPRVVKIARLPHATPELLVARRLARVAPGGHAHVVRVLETRAAQGVAVLVMEHCAGGDLFAHLARQPRGRLAPLEALRKTRELARALRFLHGDCNVAHRDLSLENVLLARDGACKLADFGLSTRADAPSRAVVGKTPYAAPEVVAGAWYDPVRADLWSLGVLLFMLLTGSPLVPWASRRCPEFRALEAVGVRGLLRAWRLHDAFANSTIELLEKLLQVEPEKRLRTADEVLKHDALAESALGR